MVNNLPLSTDYRILVVDDDEHICKLCQNTLSRAGFHVDTTSNPSTALQMVAKEHVDLVLTDIKMPQINGLQLIRQIKYIDPDLPVILMTGFASVETALQAVREGANNFVRKPFNHQELVLTVNTTLQQKKLLRENIRLKTLVNFFKVSEKFSSLHDPSKIYDLLLQAVMRETAAEKGAIFQYDPETDLYYLRHSVNLNGYISKGQTFNKTHGLPGLIFKNRSPRTVENWQDSNIKIDSIGEEKWSKYAIGVPLKFNDEVLDVLCLYKTRAKFSEADMDGTLLLVNQAAIALKNAELLLELEILFLETMKSLATTLDARDPYTHGHSRRVAQVALEIGKILQFTEKQLEELELAGILHDIGKIGIPDVILFKPGPLTPEEYEIIKTHAEKGYRILQHIKRLTSVAKAVYSHHEWHNGKGYPQGLQGDEIPLYGAIIAVADAFDTIVTDRHYRKKRSYQDALQILKNCAGSQFNPRVVEAFSQIPKKKLPQLTTIKNNDLDNP